MMNVRLVYFALICLLACSSANTVVNSTQAVRNPRGVGHPNGVALVVTEAFIEGRWFSNPQEVLANAVVLPPASGVVLRPQSGLVITSRHFIDKIYELKMQTEENKNRYRYLCAIANADLLNPRCASLSSIYVHLPDDGNIDLSIVGGFTPFGLISEGRYTPNLTTLLLADSIAEHNQKYFFSGINADDEYALVSAYRYAMVGRDIVVRHFNATLETLNVGGYTLDKYSPDNIQDYGDSGGPLTNSLNSASNQLFGILVGRVSYPACALQSQCSLSDAQTEMRDSASKNTLLNNDSFNVFKDTVTSCFEDPATATCEEEMVSAASDAQDYYITYRSFVRADLSSSSGQWLCSKLASLEPHLDSPCTQKKP